MNWGRFLLNDWFTAFELEELERRLKVNSSVAREGRASLKARIEALENDLGRVALLARALADLCLSKGLITREELVRQLLEADLADGKRDQRLQARVVMPGESQAADPEPSPAARKSRMKRKRPYP